MCSSGDHWRSNSSRASARLLSLASAYRNVARASTMLRMVVVTVARSGMYSTISVNGMPCWVSHCKCMRDGPLLFWTRNLSSGVRDATTLARNGNERQLPKVEADGRCAVYAYGDLETALRLGRAAAA